MAARDTAGEVVFSSPAAYMWDSSTPEEPAGPQRLDEGSGDGGDIPPGQFSQMPLRLNGGALTVEPDLTLLRDPDTEFPVLIDPPFHGRRMHWASVHQQQPSRGWTDDAAWPRAGGMRVGNLQWWPGFPCGDSCGLWRSAIRFGTAALAGRQIISASVKAVQTHTSGCGEYGLQLWHVDTFTSGISWNGLSPRWNDLLETRTIDSSNRSGGCVGTQPIGVTYGSSAVRQQVQQAADSSAGSLSFGFRSSDEVSKEAYRRIAIDSVRLEIEYNRPAQVPTNLNTDGHGCATTAPGPWITTRQPALSGRPRDPDGMVGAHLQVYRIGSTTPSHRFEDDAPVRDHNEVFTDIVPPADALPTGSYRWRMRSLDSHKDGTPSPWREWCYFRVDVTSPTVPRVEVVGGPPTAGQPVTLRFTASDTGSGMRRFWYGVNEEVRRSFVVAAATTSVTFNAPTTGGRMWIYVWAEDQAGNDSNRAVFDFFAARAVEATPAAAWRLDGDGLDDTGNGHELLLGSGVTWQNNGADRWLGFDGTGCVATTGPVVRYDAEYTIAMSVRLDDTSTDHTVASAAGHVQPAFSLRYAANLGRWVFALANADAADVDWAVVESATAAVAGEWTHLAVRVDSVARHLQLYVDGVLSDESGIGFAPWYVDGPLYLGCAAKLSAATWNRFHGGIGQVGVWQGLLTPTQIQAVGAGELPAGVTGEWSLRGDGTDASPHSRDLAISSTGVRWVDDPFGRRRSAIQLDGTGLAEAGGPIVRTDRSYSVATWVKIDDKSRFRTVVSQGGTQAVAFQIGYVPGSDRWHVTVADADVSGTPLRQARSTVAPVVGQWYHLVGVLDRAANQLRLYVNGELHGSAAVPAAPWAAPGRLRVGAAGTTGGTPVSHMAGAISQVQTWRGALTAAQVAEVYGGNEAVRHVSHWGLDGGGVDDLGGHHVTVVGAEGTDYEWVEDRDCLPFNALGLQLSGQGYARTNAAVLRTDESYSVTAWVKVDAVTGQWQTFLAQRGASRAAFYFQVTPTGSWRFSLSQADSASAGFVGAESAAGAVLPDTWTPVAGVYDLASGETRLYVGGTLVATGSGPTSPWHAAGPLFIGASGLEGGAVHQPFRGAVDAVSTWSSTLAPERIADLAQSPGSGVPCL